MLISVFEFMFYNANLELLAIYNFKVASSSSGILTTKLQTQVALPNNYPVDGDSSITLKLLFLLLYAFCLLLVLCYSINGLKKRIVTFWKYRHFDLSLLEIINILNAILGVIYLIYIGHLFTQ